LQLVELSNGEQQNSVVDWTRQYDACLKVEMQDGHVKLTDLKNYRFLSRLSFSTDVINGDSWKSFYAEIKAILSIRHNNPR